MMLFWLGAGLIAALAAGVWLVRGLRRLAASLRERGYLCDPNDGGGGGGVFHELDRLTRPSIEHTIAAEDFSQQEEDHAGGD